MTDVVPGTVDHAPAVVMTDVVTLRIYTADVDKIFIT